MKKHLAVAAILIALAIVCGYLPARGAYGDAVQTGWYLWFGQVR